MSDPNQMNAAPRSPREPTRRNTGQSTPEPADRISRRVALARWAQGFGSVALAAMLGEDADAAATTRPTATGPRRSLRDLAKTRGGSGLHHRARARRVIFLYMDGGPSQVDTFDPKPRLAAESGKPFPMAIEPTQFNNIGNILPSPWTFGQYGESGLEVSELFPHVARCADRLAVMRSMVSDFPEHTNANYFMHTGHGLQGRPSMGAWAGYGLGSENRDLPAYVVLNGGLVPPGGLDNFGAGFLSARHQASLFATGAPAVANIAPLEADPAWQRRKLGLLEKLDAALIEQHGREDALDSAIANYELAARMQLAVPDLYALDGESEATKRLYGFDAPYGQTRTYARQCLLARRLVERGVRFVELTCPNCGYDRWDQHSRLQRGHERNALAVDQPIAALLLDLEARGLLEDTLVVWGWGVRPHAVRSGPGRPRSQPAGVLDLARGWRRARRNGARRDGRIRLPRRRTTDDGPRSACDDPASAGRRPRAPHVPFRRTRRPSHGRLWKPDSSDPRLVSEEFRCQFRGRAGTLPVRSKTSGRDMAARLSARTRRARYIVLIALLAAGGGSAQRPAIRLSTASANAGPPRIAAAGGAVFLAWSDQRGSPIGLGRLRFARSLDAGSSYLDRDRIVDGSTRHTVFGDPGIAADGNEVWVAWSDERTGAFDVWLRRSADLGGTFAAPVRLSPAERRSGHAQRRDRGRRQQRLRGMGGRAATGCRQST